jgi:hypothetical protein
MVKAGVEAAPAAVDVICPLAVKVVAVNAAKEKVCANVSGNIKGIRVIIARNDKNIHNLLIFILSTLEEVQVRIPSLFYPYIQNRIQAIRCVYFQ